MLPSKFSSLPFSPLYIAFRGMATVKRFYRKTNILSNPGSSYEVTLDQRKLKTPKGNVFDVNNKPLALAVAVEWDSQVDIINRSNMHLTALCNTVLDNPNNLTKYDLVQYMVTYLETDTILFQSNEEDELYSRQTEKWDPLIQWFCDQFQVDVTKTKSLEAPSVPEATKAILSRHLLSYDFNSVQGFVYATEALKSVILSMAAVKGVVSVEEAVRLSRLEEEFQISYWGRVEWSHDLNKVDLQARLAAAVLFIRLNSYSTTRLPKGSDDAIDTNESIKYRARRA